MYDDMYIQIHKYIVHAYIQMIMWTTLLVEGIVEVKTP